VFSPYYAWARRRGFADPHDHVGLNVALYGPRGKRWALTERGRRALRREADALTLGPSRLEWDGDGLVVHVDEITVPFLSRLRGTVRLLPATATDHVLHLDADHQHRWTPFAPAARVEVAFAQPALRWSGNGYFDGNAGARPLEGDFAGWHWSRSHQPGGVRVYYDVTPRSTPRHAHALWFDRQGTVSDTAPPPAAELPRTLWRIGRTTHAMPEAGARVVRTLEDTPFYARSLLDIAGTMTVHESLDLDRFRRPLVQALLPFRMPRRGG
jgi:carotenoid 1,2-hydratase